MHPGIKESRLYNRLMFVGRSRVIPRLERLVRDGLALRGYGEYLDEHRERLKRIERVLDDRFFSCPTDRARRRLTGATPPRGESC